jgi:F-type H+-transporting ATPase subunit b
MIARRVLPLALAWLVSGTGFADEPHGRGTRQEHGDPHAGLEGSADGHAHDRAAAGHGVGAHDAHDEAAHVSLGDAVSSTGFIASIVNFALLLVVLFLILRRPLTQSLAARRTAIAEGLEEAAKLKATAEAKAKEYGDRLKSLGREMEDLRSEMIRSGEAERDRIVAEAEAKAARMRKDTEFLIQQQLKQLKIDMTRQAVDAAIAAAVEVLTKSATASDQERLATVYLDRLRAGVESTDRSASKSARPLTSEPQP